MPVPFLSWPTLSILWFVYSVTGWAGRVAQSGIPGLRKAKSQY
jgi:hypothetical protein